MLSKTYCGYNDMGQRGIYIFLGPGFIVYKWILSISVQKQSYLAFGTQIGQLRLRGNNQD